MSKKGNVLVSLLLLLTIALGVAATTVAAQELVVLSQETQNETSLDSLWDMSAGVATIVNPTPDVYYEEETSLVKEFLASGEASTEEEVAGEDYDIVMSDADHTLDIVAGPDEDAEVVGFLYEDCGGRIIEQADGWTLLQSGDLIGWARDENLAFDEEAYAMAAEVGQSIVIVNVQALRGRTAPDVDAEVATLFARGEELGFVEEVDADWIAVDHNNEVVYVNTAYVTRDFSVDTGETVKAIEKREEEKRLEEERKAEEAARLEEEEAKKRAEEERKIEEARIRAEEAAALEAQAAAEAEAQAAAEAEAQAAQNAAYEAQVQAALEAAERAAATQAAAAAATVDDIRFLGALIYCEAGNQSYEGKVAVGAVVMNRVKSPRYPNTIEGVIRASGQFTPVRSGKVDRVYAQGAPEECILAAQEALAGVSPVGDATHFRRNNGREGQVIGAHVFY